MEQSEQITTFLIEHPEVKKEQIIDVETGQDNKANKKLEGLAFSCSSLTWDHDEGTWSVMRATAYTDVRVDSVRNGVWNGAAFVAMAPGNLLHLRQNLDGLNYDAFSC